MTYTEQAIKIAIENGWRLRNGWEGIRIEELPTAHPNIGYWYRDTPTGREYQERVEIAEICLDPLFWQALGSWLGWNSNKGHDLDIVLSWKYYQQKMVHQIQEGKTIEDYFKELLTK